jgi:transcriptional regulator with XRE-family HTH domain
MDAEMREQLRRELDEVVLGLMVARTAKKDVSSWVRAMRLALEIRAEELAGKLGVQRREVYRLESSETEGVIGLGRLKLAAEALGCELVYGMLPRRGTLEELATKVTETRHTAREEERRRKQDAEQGHPNGKSAPVISTSVHCVSLQSCTSNRKARVRQD